MCEFVLQITFNLYLVNWGTLLVRLDCLPPFTVVSRSIWLPAKANEPGYCDDSMDPHTEAWNGLLCVETVISSACSVAASDLPVGGFAVETK